MRYDVRESADGMWEVVDLKTGQVATLGTLRLERLQHVEAMAAVDMLQSRFQQAARDRQNATDQQERTPSSVFEARTATAIGCEPGS